MSGHTPGPWRHELDPRGRRLVLPAGEPNVALAEVFEQCMNLSARGKPMYPARENARLIAAAPELLEAAKEVRDILRRDRRVFLADRLEQAIEKAEGGGA